MARGDYRHRVRFEAPGEAVPDGEGGFSESWTTIGPSEWDVAIRPATARDLESAAAGTVVASASHIVTGDYLPGLTTSARMVRLEDNRTFQIMGIANREERNRTMDVFCEERL